jgi:nitrous-oxide reductase
MKALSEIPIFAQDEAWGWTTEDPRVRAMLTNPWTGNLAVRGDTRQPVLSRINGEYDGKWIFSSDVLHPRIARVDLDTFRTGQMLWIPNVNGGLSDISIHPDSTLVVTNFEHGQYPSQEINDYLDLPLDIVEGPYVGGFAGVDVSAEGVMKNAWQVWGPWQQDSVQVGMGISDGWLVTTSYNSERSVSTLGMLGNETDYLFIWNLASIEEALTESRFTTTVHAPDVPILRWDDVEGYATPLPTNPSGVDVSPTGRYVLSGGKATSRVAVVDFEKVLAAISAGQFSGEVGGLPVLEPDIVRATTLDLGLGPTRAAFDDQGFAYIGSFVDTVVWKVTLGEPYSESHGMEPWQVVDTLSTHFSIISPLIPGGDTVNPSGEYLVAINKLAKNTFVPHGPLHTENHELFSIGSIPGQLVDQMPLGPETHGAQAIPVSLLAPSTVMAYQPPALKEEPRVEYDYDAREVRVYLDVVRSFFEPDWFTVPQGWHVNIKLTSLETALDISHGLGIDGYDVAVSLDPGEMREVTFTAGQGGVYWFYCLWYCSELHKEMRGRMIVIPQDQWVPELEWSGEDL